MIVIWRDSAEPLWQAQQQQLLTTVTAEQNNETP